LADKTYRVEIDLRAWREIMRLGEEIQNAVFDAIESLEVDPRPAGCKKLQGEEGTYRIRCGRYRIAYHVHDEVLTVLVVKVGHRSQIYRKKK
jgi:mRNA interferase RelE/StbE